MSNISEQLSTPLSPFEKLPLDVIGEIFIACLDPSVPSPMSPRKVPLLLTTVSPYLRHAAINTPKLWASISIFDANAPSKSTLGGIPESAVDDVSCVQLRTEAVKVWLRRSGGMPLSIQYAGPSGYQAQIDELSEEAMTELFLSCHSRWQDIDFELRHRSAVRVAKLIAGDVPLLRSLRLRNTESNSSFLLSSTLLRAPVLNILSLANVGRDIIRYPVIWANITHLVLHGVDAGQESISDLARLSTMANRLISLDISLQHRFPIWSQHRPDHAIILPSIQVLSIREPHRLGIVRAIHAPALRSLNLDNNPLPSELKALLSRSPAISKLDLCCDDFGEMTTALRTCASLTSLRVGMSRLPRLATTDWHGRDSVWDAFVSDDEHERVCPRLEVLDCEAFRLDFSFASLHRFLTRKQGRVPGLSRWEKVRMHVRLDQDDHQAINALISEQRKAGLVLSMGTDARDGFYLLQTSTCNIPN